MKKKFSPFQIGVYIACGVGVVFAVLIFSDKLPIGNKKAADISGSLVMWGTLPYNAMRTTTEIVSKTYKNVRVEYEEKDPETFQLELVNALASGNGPDLVTVSSTDILPNRNRFFEIPYTSLPKATFEVTFTDQGSQYLTETGVIAFPFVVDPMIMFYNRDMLSSSFTVTPPATWDDVVTLNKKITQTDDAGKLITETVALGTFDNITHAKDIISMLIFQAGNSIIKWDPIQKKYVSTFANATQSAGSSVTNAVKFYTNFANPSDTERYSWNATLPNDRDQFIAGRLAIYFGYASEIVGIRARNPNLNFNVAMMPQRSAVPTKVTYGNMTGIGVMKMSKNPVLAFTIAQLLVGQDAVTTYLSTDPTFAPARVDMLSGTTDDGIKTLIFNSTIISKSFLDPNPDQMDAFWRKYIGQINAGLVQPEQILSPGNSLLGSILEKI